MILLVSTILSVLMGEVTEAITIIVIVLLNALLGFFQEFRTEKTLDKLKNMAAPQATVIRDGIPVIIPASQIVRDDVILLKAGDRVPADGILLDANSLFSDESLLSGESVEVEKLPSTDGLYGYGNHKGPWPRLGGIHRNAKRDGAYCRHAQ